jgi:hypothetical protein
MTHFFENILKWSSFIPVRQHQIADELLDFERELGAVINAQRCYDKRCNR